MLSRYGLLLYGTPPPTTHPPMGWGLPAVSSFSEGGDDARPRWGLMINSQPSMSGPALFPRRGVFAYRSYAHPAISAIAGRGRTALPSPLGRVRRKNRGQLSQGGIASALPMIGSTGWRSALTNTSSSAPGPRSRMIRLFHWRR